MPHQQGDNWLANGALKGHKTLAHAMTWRLRGFLSRLHLIRMNRRIHCLLCWVLIITHCLPLLAHLSRERGGGQRGSRQPTSLKGLSSCNFLYLQSFLLWCILL